MTVIKYRIVKSSLAHTHCLTYTPLIHTHTHPYSIIYWLKIVYFIFHFELNFYYVIKSKSNLQSKRIEQIHDDAYSYSYRLIVDAIVGTDVDVVSLVVVAFLSSALISWNYKHLWRNDTKFIAYFYRSGQW